MSFGWSPCELCGTRVPEGLLARRTIGASTESLCMTCTGALEKLESMGESRVDRARFLYANGAMREEIAEQADSGTTINPIDSLVRFYRGE